MSLSGSIPRSFGYRLPIHVWAVFDNAREEPQDQFSDA